MKFTIRREVRGDAAARKIAHFAHNEHVQARGAAPVMAETDVGKERAANRGWRTLAERKAVGKSIRRECLDHLLGVNTAHLRSVLKAYADHYNHDRTHLGLAKDTPRPRVVEPAGIVSEPFLGGLHHRCRRIRRIEGFRQGQLLRRIGSIESNWNFLRDCT